MQAARAPARTIACSPIDAKDKARIRFSSDEHSHARHRLPAISDEAPPSRDRIFPTRDSRSSTSPSCVWIRFARCPHASVRRRSSAFASSRFRRPSSHAARVEPLSFRAFSRDSRVSDSLRAASDDSFRAFSLSSIISFRRFSFRSTFLRASKYSCAASCARMSCADPESSA